MNNWPFTTVMVDHLFYGTTRIWWSLYDEFNDAAPYTFQLQAGYTDSPSSLDWVNIGSTAVNAFYLDDETGRERHGNILLTHYRVVLTTAQGTTYVSAPQGIFGTLAMNDWRIANEIIRRETLQMTKVGRPGYLLHRMRYGVLCTNSTDPLTREIINSDHPESYGTQFKVGYHPPTGLMIDPSLRIITETRDATSPQGHDGRPRQLRAKVVGFRMLNKADVWVDATTDERWEVADVHTTAAIRGVPIVHDITLTLIPFSNVVYKIPVTSLSTDPTDNEKNQPTSGTGCVPVDHDYPTQSAMVYQGGDCCGIAGATILAFRMTDWNNGNRVETAAVAKSQTMANGLWAWQMLLDPGTYMLVFSKVPEYGPDHVELVVTAPPPEPADSSSIATSESVSGSVSSDSLPQPHFVDTFGQF